MLILHGLHKDPRTTDLVKWGRKSRVLWSDAPGLEHFLCPIRQPSITQPSTHQILEDPQGARHTGRLCGCRWAKRIQTAYVLVRGERHLTNSHTDVSSPIVVSSVESTQHSLSVDRGWECESREGFPEKMTLGLSLEWWRESPRGRGSGRTFWAEGTAQVESTVVTGSTNLWGPGGRSKWPRDGGELRARSGSEDVVCLW